VNGQCLAQTTGSAFTLATSTGEAVRSEHPAVDGVGNASGSPVGRHRTIIPDGPPTGVLGIEAEWVLRMADVLAQLRLDDLRISTVRA
jgi:hypothetical protein